MTGAAQARAVNSISCGPNRATAMWAAPLSDVHGKPPPLLHWAGWAAPSYSSPAVSSPINASWTTLPKPVGSHRKQKLKERVETWRPQLQEQPEEQGVAA